MDEITEEVVQRDDVSGPWPWNLTCSPAFGAGAGNCGGDARTHTDQLPGGRSVRSWMCVISE